METLTNVIGWIGFVTGSALMLPQAIKTIRTKDTKSVSIYMFIIGFLNFATWLTYGFLINSPQIYVANIIALICNCIILTYAIINIVIDKRNKKSNQD